MEPRVIDAERGPRWHPSRLPARHLAAGWLTGRGADIILIDDPLKPEQALSDAQRKSANEWYDHTLCSRLNDKRHGAIVIIMQRVHENDLVGNRQ